MDYTNIDNVMDGSPASAVSTEISSVSATTNRGAVESRIRWTDTMDKDLVNCAKIHEAHLSSGNLTKVQKWTNVANQLWTMQHFIAAQREPLKHQALKNRFKKLQNLVKAKVGIDNETGHAEMTTTEEVLLTMAKEEERAKQRRNAEQARTTNRLQQESVVQAMNGIISVNQRARTNSATVVAGTGEQGPNVEDGGGVDETATSTDEKSVTSKGTFSSAGLKPLDSVSKKLEETFGGSAGTSASVTEWDIEERRRRLEMEEEDRKQEREEKRMRLEMEREKMEMDRERDQRMLLLMQNLYAHVTAQGTTSGNAASTPARSGHSGSTLSPHAIFRAWLGGNSNNSC